MSEKRKTVARPVKRRLLVLSGPVYDDPVQVHVDRAQELLHTTGPGRGARLTQAIAEIQEALKAFIRQGNDATP